MALLRASIITDIHLGERHGSKWGDRALDLMPEFIAASRAHNPHCLISMGDNIYATNARTARANTRRIHDEFNKVGAPKQIIAIGNHEPRHMKLPEIAAITGCPATNYTADVEGFHFVVFNPHDFNGKDFMKPSLADMQWFKSAITSTDKPTIVVSHVPVLGGIKSKEWAKPNKRYSYGDTDMQEIMESGNVILCLSGHLHHEYHESVGGIHHIVQQSATAHPKEWGDKRDGITGTYSLLTITDDNIELDIRGHSRKVLNLKPRVTSKAQALEAA